MSPSRQSLLRLETAAPRSPMAIAKIRPESQAGEESMVNSDARNDTGDPFALRQLYQPLRVVDVCDALGGIGYFDIGRLSRVVRPRWRVMKFWGVAFTMRSSA